MDELFVVALAGGALRLGAPLLIAAVGELWVERSGVVNIGIEGMMLTGAFVGFAVALASGSPVVGVLAALLSGAAWGGVFAYFAVVRGADQIVVGMAINLLAAGATGLASRALYAGAVPTGATLGGTPVALGAVLLVAASALLLGRTRLGLRVRAVGESARGADTEGIPVSLVRAAVLAVGGALAAAAGATLSLAQTNTFTEGMTAGRGFIALAIVIFGRWRPGGALAAALFFGLATALQFRLQARGLGIPYPVFLMFPYAVTLVVLAVAAAGGRAPAELGRPYRRESR